MKIIINGRECDMKNERLSYAQIAFLAFPKMKTPARNNPSITFFNADQDKSQGILNHRSSIKVKDGTRINCHFTTAA